MAKKIDVLKHKLVLSHKLLSSEEKDALLNSLNISIAQLPSIKQKDPAIESLNAKLEDIIEILRENPTGTDKFFRRVIR